MTMKTKKQSNRSNLGLPLPKQIVSRAVTERLIVFIMGGFWGLVLLGVAVWLFKHGSPGGAVACLTFSSAYFWFAWVGYHDPHK